jgi:hypothetical protein
LSTGKARARQGSIVIVSPSLGDAVDHAGTGPADAFATVAVEGDRIFAAGDQILVDDVEHLQKGHVRRNVLGFVGDEAAAVVRTRLAPDLQGEVHHL